MEREKFLESWSIILKLDEDDWDRDENGLIYFYNEEKMPPEAIEAARLLNENYAGLAKDEEENEKNYPDKIYITF